MSHSPFNIAFIGGGETSAVGYVHFCASQMDNRFKVVAGAFCRCPDENSSTGNYWGISPNRIYNNWQTLIDIEKNQIDAVIILTPTPDHLPMIVELLKHNIPIVSEKALVCGPSDIAELERAYQADKHFLAVTFNYSGYAMVRELREIILDDKLGKIQKIHLEMPQEGFRRPPDIAGKTASPQAWRLHDEEVPTICLDLGVHLHHLSSFLIGHEPIATVAQFSNHSQYKGLVDDVHMLLKYPYDIKGSMWMSKTAIGNRNGLKIRIFGDKGSATWFQLNPDELELNFHDGVRQILDRASDCQLATDFRYNRMKPGHPTGFVEAFGNLYTDIADKLLAFKQGKIENSPFVFGLEHAKQGLALFSAAKQSNESGLWQNISTE